MKICRDCGTELNDSNWFPCDKKLPKHVCKSCHVKRTKEYRHKNRDKWNAYQREYARKHKELKAKYTREWRLRHLEQAREYSRRYYYTHKGKR